MPLVWNQLAWEALTPRTGTSTQASAPIDSKTHDYHHKDKRNTVPQLASPHSRPYRSQASAPHREGLPEDLHVCRALGSSTEPRVSVSPPECGALQDHPRKGFYILARRVCGTACWKSGIYEELYTWICSYLKLAGFVQVSGY